MYKKYSIHVVDDQCLKIIYDHIVKHEWRKLRRILRFIGELS